MSGTDEMTGIRRSKISSNSRGGGGSPKAEKKKGSARSSRGNSILGSFGASMFHQDNVSLDVVYLYESFAQDAFTQQFENRETEASYVAFTVTNRSVQLLAAAFGFIGFLYSGYGSSWVALNPTIGALYFLGSVACLVIFITTLAITYPSKHPSLQDNALLTLNASRLEKLHVATWLATGLAVCIGEFGWISIDCEIYAQDSNEYNVAYCREGLFGYAAMQMSLALFLFQARALVVLPGLVLLFVSLCFGYWFASMMPEGKMDLHRRQVAMRLITLASQLFVIAGSVWVQELQNRDRFRWASMKRTEGILSLHKTAIAKIVTSILPGDTVSKLVANKAVFDSRDNCAVAVVQLDDFVRWTTSLQPKQVVLALDRVSCALDQLTHSPVEKVGYYGDIFVFSLGLKMELKQSESGEESSIVDASSSETAAAPFTDLLLHCFRLASRLGSTDWVDDDPTGLECLRQHVLGSRITAQWAAQSHLHSKIGVASGPCSGGLVGSNLRYNLLGPAFDRAQSAAQLARHGSVVASEEFLTQCQESLFIRVSGPAALIRLTDNQKAVSVLKAPLPKAKGRSPAKAAPGEKNSDVIETSVVASSSDVRANSEEDAGSPTSWCELQTMLQQGTLFNDSLPSETDLSSINNNTTESNSTGGNQAMKSSLTSLDDEGEVEEQIGVVTAGCCGFGRTFGTSSQEEAYRAFTLEQDQQVANRVLDSAAGVLFCITLLCVPIYEEKYSVAGIVSACITFLFVFLRTALSDVIPGKFSPILVAFQVIMYQVTVGVNPTNLLNGQVIMLLLMCLHTLYVGVPRGSTIAELLLAIGTALGTLVLFVARFGFPFSSFLETTIYLVIYTPVIAHALNVRDAERRENYIDYRRTQITTTSVQEEKRTLNSLLTKLVPDYAVAIVFRRSVVENQPARVMKPLCDLIAMEATLDDSNPMSTSPRRAGPPSRKSLVAKVAVIEALMAELGGGLLNIANILGDSIQIAGPLKDPGKQNLQLKNSVVEMRIEQLVRQQRDQDKRLFECLANVMRFVDAVMTRLGRSCTLVLSSGSGFGAVIGSHPPQFSVLGVAPRLATALRRSVPVQGHVFVSSSFHNLVEWHSGMDTIMTELNLGFEGQATWRIRGAGSQQVRVLKRKHVLQDAEGMSKNELTRTSDTPAGCEVKRNVKM